ncbi:selenide, water dikinase SelD [candidate division KSB1 bacterium]|nr:selenide, water dikinase SelD [candidate division KSB1 bacterium]
MKRPIYLDHNATTPIADEVASVMLPYLKEHFGNPSSSHTYGIETKRAVENARKQVAELLGCHSDEIIFTSGGSESNNLALKGFVELNKSKGNHIITLTIEHPAILNVCKYLEDHGYDVSYIPVDNYGRIDIQDVENAIRPTTILITIMHANNEVGTIQPLADIASIAHQHGIKLHTDAAQSVGKIPTMVNKLGVDMLSIAGHKLYAPKGVGALYIRRGVKLSSLIHGADHERHLRAGTENVMEIVGLGAACAIAKRNLDHNMKQYKQLRDRLWEGLKNRIPSIVLNGHPEFRLPNTLSIGFPDIDANTLLDELSQVAASPGAACHTDVAEPSHVLVSMKVPLNISLGTIRFSTGLLNDESQIDEAIDYIATAVTRLYDGHQSPAPEETTAINDIKLTHFTHGLGCACKIRPQNLEKILKTLPNFEHPNVLVGNRTSDDAAVYKINNNTAIVQTVDFFTPVVDDPYHFGAIAAANSLSDIYAMGATPLFALNVVGFPEKRLPIEVLQRILVGAADKTREAGIPILGGHTVEDPEPKFGLVVTGAIDTQRIVTNAAAEPGDLLILTKPLGLGIITTALKRGLVDNDLRDRTIEIMESLNRVAGEKMINYRANACTDITGFGLLGHLKELTTASKVDALLFADQIPLIPEAYDFASANIIPGGTKANMSYVSDWISWDEEITEILKIILCDAQTSGGLLISLPEPFARPFIEELELNSVNASIIGKIIRPGNGEIMVNRSSD